MKYVNHGEVIHEPLYYYCQNDNSLSRSYRPDRFQKVVKLYLYEKQILQDMDAFDSGRLQMQRTFIANVRTCNFKSVFQQIFRKPAHSDSAYCYKIIFLLVQSSIPNHHLIINTYNYNTEKF